MISLVAIVFQTIFDQFGEDFQGFGNAFGGFDQISSYIAYAFILGLFSFLAFGVIRFILNTKMYVADTGEHFGKMRIGFQGKSDLTGNLSRARHPFALDILEELKDIPQIKQGIEQMEKYVKDGLLFCYDYKVTDFESMPKFKSNSNDALIISSAPLEDPHYSWQTDKGYVNWGSLSKEPMREVYCYRTSEPFPIDTPDHNKKDVWVVAPIPGSEKEGRTTFGFTPEGFSQTTHILNVNVLPNKKELAVAAVFMRNLIELHRLLKDQQIQKETLIEMMDELNRRNIEQNFKENFLVNELNKQPITGYAAPTVPEEKGFPYMWMFAAGLCAVIGALLPENSQPGTALANFPPWLSGFIGFGIPMAIVAIKNSRKKPEDKIKAELERQRTASSGV